MPSQNHVVLREIVEVAIPHGSYARAMHEAVGRVMRAVLPALVQRQCDESCPADVIHRLETVEVDLGRLPLAGFEAALTRALETVLPVRLAEAIRASERPAGGERLTHAASHIELMDHFTRTGVLPWWADRTKADALAESLHFLCREAGRESIPWMRRWTQDVSSLHRLVRACTDDDLHALVRILQAEETAGELREWINAFQVLAEEVLSRTLPPGQRRHHVWQSVLSAAGSAPVLGCDPAVLRCAMVEHLWSACSLSAASLPEALARLAEPGGGRRAPAAIEGPNRWREAEPALAALLDLVGPFPTRQTVRKDIPPQLSSDALRRALRTALAAGTLSADALLTWLSRFEADRTPFAQALCAEVRAALVLIPPAPSAPAKPRRPSFGESDVFYVDNAGLVVLAPFLPHFFAQLGLLVDKKFPDETARQRATVLLQFLLTEDRLPPLEHVLPLNKILCGLMVEDLFEPDLPVTDDEQAEGERLLTAVIEHAPILHQMSLDGFRGSFLARTGQISVRDGAWLLRVERETYDVVLDRFPWSFQWISLPWMSTPLFVEW